MATLADELLNDFEDSGSENGEPDTAYENGDGAFPDDNGQRHDRTGSRDQSPSPSPGMELDGDEEGEDEGGDAEEETAARRVQADHADDEDTTKAKVEKMKLGGVSDVRSIAGLMKTLQPVLDKIAHYQSIPPDKQTTGIGNVEDDPEYRLLTQSNSLSTQIDSEIILVHKFVRDHYSTRFPELETLVQNPLDYAKTVAILKNGPLDKVNQLAASSDNIVNAPLRSILDGPTLMVVKVEAVRSRGQDMTDAELQTTLRACEMIVQLDRAKKTLTEYVRSRMDIFAPNLTILIGSLTAAQLLNFAGGLQGLAKTPDRNIPAMGTRRQKQSGLATNVGIRHQGFLYHSDLIQSIPNDLRIKAMRIVSCKLVLAARVDRVHQSRDGSTGVQLLEDCMRRIDKLTEPPPNRGPRALPAPDDKPSRKRGGRRARKAKEATAMTDLRKQQNRMAFGKEEKEVGYGGETQGLGVIGQENDGRIRATQIDRRTMAKLSKKNPGWAGSGLASSLNSGMSTSLKGFGSGGATSLRVHGLRTSGVGGASAGTASSIAFTPTAGGFKVPGLPPAKKSNMGPPPKV
ncbi:hypothetical protein DV737_g2966, partial [Chaetothyriales sp. CBS 132003]